MYIHEYQAKQILAEFKVPVKKGRMIDNLSQIPAALKELADGVIVVKAQIHAGGRGKAGGVKIAKTKADVEALAKPMLGMTLVTHQTGAEGSKVNKLYLEEGSNIEKEYYLSMLVDRETSRITIMASAEGGVEIEEVAAHHPEKIFKIAIDPASGIQAFHARDIAFKLGFKGDLVKKFTSYCMALYDVCIAKDASQVEINPLVVTKEGELVTLDAKFNFDDNALFRQADVLAMRDEEEEDPLEVRAAQAGLSYVKMDGTIGCMVNGAGLAMATMDIIKLCGGEPANFLDVGGGATRERVTEAFKIILSDKNVKGILVNIFGGIMRCDIIAEGVIAAAKDVGLSVPLVVRLAGTNVDLGKKILETSGLKVISADDLGDAAKKIVKAISE